MKIEQYSPALWVLKNGFKNERGNLLTFDQHLFLFDIYNDLTPHQVIKKCAQVGISVMLNLKAIFLAKFRGITTILTMPSDDDVTQFVTTKTDKIIQSNYDIKKDLTIDNVHLKQIKNSFIYYKGTISKSAPISTTSDLLVHDEIDRSLSTIIEQYRSRISFSKYKGVWEVSNPSIINQGVDISWKQSDKKEWFITCDGCHKEQYLVWKDNVDEIKGVYVCKFCGKELTKKEIILGRWKPTATGDISGYHISQMMATWLTAKDLIKEKETRGIQYFYNFVLGEPYSSGVSQNFRQIITDCCSLNTLDQEPFFMGVDVGIEKHYVLGSKRGIFEVGKVRDKKSLEAIIERYNPIIIMDAGPERTWAEEFKQKYPKLFLCFYQHDKDQKEIAKWGGEKGTEEDSKNWGYVHVDRNRAIDKVINEILSGNILFNVTRDKLELYIAQWETLRRKEEITGLGTRKYVWDSTTGEDHYCYASVYYWLATTRSGEATFIREGDDTKDVIITTNEGFKMRSLEEIIKIANANKSNY